MSNRKYTNKLNIKIKSVGDVEVGKSCLIKKYCEGSFMSDYIKTIGINYELKKISFRDTLVAINIFDLNGDDDYKEVRIQFYKDSIWILMIYDSNIKATYDSLVR